MSNNIAQKQYRIYSTYIESKKRKDGKQNIKYNRKQDKTIGQASG